MTSGRLLAPPITIDTAPPTQAQQFPDHDRITPLPSPTVDERGLLTVHVPSSPTGSSADSATLRSRSFSGSRSDTLRSRANSFNTFNGSAFEVSTEDALRPDPGREADFAVDDNPFAFTPGQLGKLIDPKSLAAYKALGGLRGLERGLRTDLVAGLSVDETQLHDRVTFEEATSAKGSKPVDDRPIPSSDAVVSGHAVPNQFDDRVRVFKKNVLPEKKAKSFWKLLWLAYNDKILILLTVAAVISLALGLYETLGQVREPGEPMPVDWVEGVAICVAIIIVVIVTALNDWQKEKQFVRLNRKKEDRQVKAIRSGKSVLISVFDITVGDVLHLEPGDLIPADGIFISGHNVKCDESSATGESDQMKKTPGEEVFRQLENGTASPKLDPFIISGSKVLEGMGTYLVTGVGVYSSYGKIMMALSTDNDPTPLQVKLDGLAGAIAKLGSGAAILLFAILLIRFLAQLPGNHDTPAVKASAFMDILIVAITIIVVAVPEGLPLAVTLALAFATTRMLKENNLVRVLRACETMGNATTICSDKTGTLTQNKMTVVAGTIGTNTRFEQTTDTDGKETAATSIPAAIQKLSGPVSELLRKSISINSTAFEGEENGIQTFIGSKTETALLMFAKNHLGLGPVAEERSSTDIVQLIPFDSGRKCMGVLYRLPSGSYRLLVKGASEILVAHSTKELGDVSQEKLDAVDLTDNARSELGNTITTYAERSLRTIGLAYRDFHHWPPANVNMAEGDAGMVEFNDIFKDMTLLAIVGIQDPLRPGVTDAVKKCQNAGVVVRMVTGDNPTTALAIARECGIKTEEGIIMEGPKFRQLSESEMAEILPRLQVLARSSPEDKRILVQQLKRLGETVAVTGDGTNDGPALKTADVGFSMGIDGTEVAKEASSIILMDNNFASIVKALMWGRAVNDAVAKFLQFQITVNITAVILAFVSAVSSSTSTSVLSAVQLLWVNLIMDTFAALALATDAPTEEILDRKPSPKSAPLITTNMWKMVTGQAVYQLAVTFILYFGGKKILGYTSEQQSQLDTIVFNTFVWMQIFNEFNNRRLDNKFNIFEGVHRKWFFMGINAIMIGGQIMIVFIGGKAFQVVRLNGGQWAICVLCALGCIPWAVVLRCIPDAVAGKIFHVVGKIFWFVALPVTKAWSGFQKGFMNPLKRFISKVFRRKPKAEVVEMDEGATVPDEEAAPPSTPQWKRIEEEEEAEMSPRTLVVPPPPITVTAA